MAWYQGAVRRPIPEANTQPDIRPRGVCLHTAVSNSKSLFGFWTSPGSDGVESHFYLQQPGTAEQYVGTETRADCQVDGNPYCISVECWDGAGVVWTQNKDIPGYNTAQVKWLIAFLVWCHDEHGIPLRTMKFMGDSGVGYHRQFIGPRPSFATKPRECPGDRKAAQIPGIVAAAAKVAADRNKPTPPPEDDMPTPQEFWDYPLADVDGREVSAREYVVGTRQKLDRMTIEERAEDDTEGLTLATLTAAIATLTAKVDALTPKES